MFFLCVCVFLFVTRILNVQSLPPEYSLTKCVENTQSLVSIFFLFFCLRCCYCGGHPTRAYGRRRQHRRSQCMTTVCIFLAPLSPRAPYTWRRSQPLQPHTSRPGSPGRSWRGAARRGASASCTFTAPPSPPRASAARRAKAGLAYLCACNS